MVPVILAALGVVAGGKGVVDTVQGISKIKDANETKNLAEIRHKNNINKFENQNRATCTLMDEVGKRELEILKSFERFSDIIERIQNRPEFKGYKKENINLPEYNPEELQKAYVGAGVLLGALGGATLGTAGGFAAAGATTAAVTALGSASTGTAIASLSGAAATNATLAFLGGGSIAAGGGGIALGSAVLGASTLGIGLLLGGFIFNKAGNSVSEQADEVYAEAAKEGKIVDEICSYLKELYSAAEKFNNSLKIVELNYKDHMNNLENIVMINNKTDWEYFTQDEKIITENTVLLVALLYRMCKVKMVLEDGEAKKNIVNSHAISSSVLEANDFLHDKLHKDIPDISNQKAKELFVMGDRYYLGKMCKVDQRMAVKYYEDSAVLGYEPAQCKLAKCYEFGYGCEKDKQKSLFWYEKAAENGNMEAQYKVGISYDFGRGCAIDKSKALMWYRTPCIINRILRLKCEITVEELAEAVGQYGHSFTPAVFKDGAKHKTKDSFLQQSVFAIDIDDNLSSEDFLCRCKEYDLHPAFLYHTFSSTKAIEKFRAVFVLEKPITDSNIAEFILVLFFEVFPETDNQCKDCSRLFYGGKELFYTDFSAVLDIEKLVIKITIRGDSRDY